MMGEGMTTMSDIMLLFTELSNAKFNQMTLKTDVSRNVQDNGLARYFLLLKQADLPALNSAT